MPPVLKNVTRLDSTPVNQTFFTEEGYLRDMPVLTSTGIFEYANPDGSLRRELRLPEDVFDTRSLESYEGKPIIITHDAGLVDKSNVHRFQIGTILSSGVQSGNDVRAKIIIHNTDEMQQCGLKELSLGYNLDLVEEPGEWNGMHYDAIQKNIRINHLALVREARAGDQARLNIDSRDGNTLKGGKLMSKAVVKNARRADSILSPEELEKAIKEYKERRASYGKDADDVDPEKKAEGTTPVEDIVNPKDAPVEKPAPVMPQKEEPVPKVEEDEDEEPTAKITEEVEAVKQNRGARAEEGTPDTDEKAKKVIMDQDMDIGILLDIIDTLLAERAFDEAEPVKDPEKDPADPNEEVLEDEDDTEVDPDKLAVDPVEEPDKEDDDDDVIPNRGNTFAEEEEVVEEDEDDTEVEKEEELTFKKDCGHTKMNADSMDRIVRERIKLGMIGKALNLDGLENMKVMKAKKAIIKAVRPSVNLDGKSTTYINAMFECAVQDVEKNTRKDTNYQRRQMFNKDSRTASRKATGSEAARQRMIERRQKND